MSPAWRQCYMSCGTLPRSYEKVALRHAHVKKKEWRPMPMALIQIGSAIFNSFLAMKIVVCAVLVFGNWKKLKFRACFLYLAPVGWSVGTVLIPKQYSQPRYSATFTYSPQKPLNKNFLIQYRNLLPQAAANKQCSYMQVLWTSSSDIAFLTCICFRRRLLCVTLEISRIAPWYRDVTPGTLTAVWGRVAGWVGE
jgi:hypothetical protein